MLIGITGSIGSGKSVVAQMLAEMLQAPLFSSDEICRRLLEKGEAGYMEMVATWGDRYLTEDGEIDRRRLRTAVFAERKVRTVLEEILHPLVRAELLRAKAASGSSPLLLAEVPLLFECGWEADFDYIVCVTAPSEVARQRVVERDAVGPAEVERISSTQMNSTLKAARSDWVIENSGSLEQTRIEVARLAAQLGAVPASNKSD